MSARRTTRTAAAVATLALGVAALAGCAGGAGTATATPSAAATGGSSAAGVDPNGPEPAAAGDIPDNQAFVPFSPQGASFTVSVPEGWSRTSSGASSTTFTDKLSSVTVDVAQQGQAPTVASVEGTELAKVSAAATGYRAGTTQQVTRTAGPVVESTYRADAAPDPVTGKVVSDDVSRYAYFKDGTEVVLTLAGPHGADNVDPWRTITDSFSWTATP